MAQPEYQHIICDPAKCTGCRLCEYACSMVKTGKFDASLSRIRVVRIEPITMTAIACRLCADAPCIIACPRDALSRSERNGIILVDQDKCDGCGWCIEACDFGAIVLNPETKNAEICDLCQDLEGEPPCIAYCPMEALSLGTPETLRQKARREVVAKLFEELLKE
ncbi:MAG: 4Fe-4S dicluster domain-containing protein [Chloroflexi bacterium]|nr:4Fe-4S dicluster domain-containing protein [Chloroflexota bacterium]MBC7316005.1 4Fe-4S dicluster domain-containing protein [Chloroflexota bacterium]